MASPCDGGCRGPWPESTSSSWRFSGAIPRWQSSAYSPSRCDFRGIFTRRLLHGLVAFSKFCKWVDVRLKGGFANKECVRFWRVAVWTAAGERNPSRTMETAWGCFAPLCENTLSWQPSGTGNLGKFIFEAFPLIMSDSLHKSKKKTKTLSVGFKCVTIRTLSQTVAATPFLAVVIITNSAALAENLGCASAGPGFPPLSWVPLLGEEWNRRKAVLSSSSSIVQHKGSELQVWPGKQKGLWASQHNCAPPPVSGPWCVWLFGVGGVEGGGF